MKTLALRIVLGALVLAALIALIGFLTRPAPVKVVVSAAERARVEATLSNTRSGTVESCQRTRLSTILGGRIEALLVKEDQVVRRGQKIAEMGSSDADRVQLHFEIRRQGKPVDPARYLPPR